MLYRAEIVALLDPLVSGRVYAEHFPQEPLPDWPAIRVSRTGGTVESSNCGSGDEDSDSVYFAIDIVAMTVDEAEDTASLARAALQNMTTPTTVENHFETRHDFETRTHICTLQICVHGSSN